MSVHGIAVSLFAGAGGLDIGAERAGYEVRAAVEWERDAAATMEKNFARLVSPVICKNILMREIDVAGYHCEAKVLNAADYGVPQAHPRLFIIGVAKDEPCPRLPEPTHGARWERRMTGDPQRPHVTAGEALAGLVTQPEPGESVNGKYGHLLPAIPPGDNYLFYTARRGHPDPLFRWRGKYWSFC